ncbi:MAG: aldo/keto reductase [Holophagales bacterium]|nr:aldo/keto reductase [Holophagales bacterium]
MGGSCEARPFGTTGLRVPPLGFGAGAVGDVALDEGEAGRLLNGALDLGLSFVDTAPGYGLSEERIGRHLSHRRAEFVLSTKLGYAVPGVPDWSEKCIARGVDLALAASRELGVVAKRPLANTPWNPRAAHPDDAAAAAYQDRWRALHLEDLGLDPAELAIRFAAFAPGVSTAIVGSRRLEHLAEIQALVAKGPLPPDVVSEITARFATLGQNWPGMI